MRKASFDDLLRQYKKAALTHREASREGDHRRANRAHRDLEDIVRDLRNRSRVELELFLDLMDDPAPEVRGWAATHALEFAPARAEATLEEISEGQKSLEEFSARMVLKEWRAGRLQKP